MSALREWMMIDEADATSASRRAMLFLVALRPALPAVIGAAALTFLFVAFMPMSWVAAISWNLYLDRLFDLFVPPVGNGARLALALGMSALSAMIAAFVALLAAEPAAVGLGSRSGGLGRDAHLDDAHGDPLPPRRRADRHPDDTLRPPIRAGRDLPAGGLGPIVPNSARPRDEQMAFVDAIIETQDELVLADLAPFEPSDAAEAPWLQPAEFSGPAMPDPADHSLGAMVARLEAGLARRMQNLPASPPMPVPGIAAANEDEESGIDFALEAALGTLQRLNRQTVG